MNLTEFKKSAKSDRPHYLLLGHPVEHSWSPLMHNTALQHFGMEPRYFAIDLQNNELAELAAFFNWDAFLGANVTIPFKQMITDYLDEVDQTARDIGAVNTLVKQQHRLEGHNTDAEGFLAPLDEFEDTIRSGTAIVFGTGGAAQAIIIGLIGLNVESIYVVSRTPKQVSSFDGLGQVHVISYDQWTTYADESMLIVNATPIGMYPDVNRSPVRDLEKAFLKDHICYDIVYNPLKTKFLQQAQDVGASTINGLEMLIHQGSRSFELWTGQPFPMEIVRNTLYERLAD